MFRKSELGFLLRWKFRTRWTLESFDFLHVSRCCTSHHLCRYALHYQVWLLFMAFFQFWIMNPNKNYFIINLNDCSWTFIFSLLPLANIQNQRVLVRLNTILTVAIALTCMLNVLASTLIFAESKESFYQPQPANPIDDE